MEQHLREFFISQIKLGIIYDEDFIIEPFKTIDLINSYKIYENAYDDCAFNGIMTNEEMLSWLNSQNLWNDKKEKDIDSTQDIIENIKIEMFNNSLNKTKVESLRKQLRSLEKALLKGISFKNSLFQNTCETNADQEQKTWLIMNSIKIKNDKFIIEDNIHRIYNVYQNNILSDKQIRELARTEPWSSFWIIFDKAKISPFKYYKDRELTINQKNLLMWSQTYDNIQESIDCPDRAIIDDDDLLDGWFITQSRERQKEKKKKLLDSSIKSKKITSSEEVFVISEDPDQVESIQSLNTEKSKFILQQRMQKIEKTGSSDFYNFDDKKLDVIQEAMKKNKGK